MAQVIQSPVRLCSFLQGHAFFYESGMHCSKISRRKPVSLGLMGRRVQNEGQVHNNVPCHGKGQLGLPNGSSFKAGYDE